MPPPATASAQPALITTPYWWGTCALVGTGEPRLPARTDVLIVGAGYTGLSAALQLARAGRSVVVVDAERPGWGCSTRNGGQVSTSLKGTLEGLAWKHGPELARAILEEGRNAYAHIKRFIAEEGIDCDFSITGRFIGAHSRAALARQERAVAAAGDPSALSLVPRERVREELASDRYFGGIVQHDIGAINPAKYHAGLMRRALDAGVAIVAPCRVTSLDENPAGVSARTSCGTIVAADVLVATNGYTGPELPEFRRRIIPIASHVAATQPLDPGVAASLIPKGRMAGDTRRVVIYHRLAPDGRRLLFGARVSIGEVGPAKAARRMQREIGWVFPQLQDVPLSHCWHGYVGFTFDVLPHTGARGHIHHCMGYCGSGISLATYFGAKAGLRILGRQEGRTALDAVAFPRRFYYSQRPWFMPAALVGYRLLDRIGR